MHAHPEQMDMIRLPLVLSRDGRLVWRLMRLAYQAEWSMRWRSDPHHVDADTETNLEPVEV
ncbi:MAG: hypothetical protein H0W72_01395 [Planctomycetes bacterium]|nr:hypothetical protein [Planctomycetota bacterium]